MPAPSPAYLELEERDRAALILPFHYSYGLSVLNSHLTTGASIYFPHSSASDAGFVEELRDAGCTNISGVPYSFEQMDRAGFLQHELPNTCCFDIALSLPQKTH